MDKSNNIHSNNNSKKRYGQIFLKTKSIQKNQYKTIPQQMIKYDTLQQNNHQILQQAKYKKVSNQQDKQKDHKEKFSHKKQKNFKQSDIQYQQQDLQSENMDRDWSEVPFSLSFMIGYLYFVQGVLLGIPATMPYIYPNLPNYSILSIFALSSIPFSFKFLTAPFLQRFNFPIYGKRKTYIVSSQILSSIVLFACGFLTQQSVEIYFAILMMIVIFLITLQDIALDAVSIKQTRSATLTSALVTVFQGFGIIFGSLALLKLTSAEFAKNTLNRYQPLMNISTVLHGMSIFIILPTFLIHFFFHQTILQTELIISQKSFCQILSYYKIFINIKSKHCRTVIFFLLFLQGAVLFSAGYEYQLIKAGFSKDKLNSISNITSIPVSIVAFFMTKIVHQMGCKISLWMFMGCDILIRLYLYFIFPIDVTSVTILSFLSGLTETCIFIVTNTMMNSFPKSGVMGMFITMLGSASNFGKNSAYQTKLTGIFGWKTIALIGLIFYTFTFLINGKAFDWIQRGDVGINGEMIDDNEFKLEQQVNEKKSKQEQINKIKSLQFN